MSQKVYVKPPAPTRTMLKAQMVVVSLFLPLGPVLVFVAEGEARPFVALFALIWVAGCISPFLSETYCSLYRRQLYCGAHFPRQIVV